MKKVLILHNILWSPYKAAVFTELGRQCNTARFELLVLHLAPKGSGQQQFGNVDLALHQYPFKVLTDQEYEKIRWAGIFFRILAEIRSFQPDILVLPGYGPLSICLLPMLRPFRITSVMAVDSTGHDRPRSFWKEILKKAVVRQCTAFQSFGTRTDRYLMHLGVGKQEIFSNCQAVDNAVLAENARKARLNQEKVKFDLNLQACNFIFVGRLVPEKNIRTLLRAFHQIKTCSRRADGWGLVLVGDGVEREALETMVEEYRIKDVKFLGGKSWDKVPEVLAICDVLVLPSVSEPWGMVVNEAMACGLPVIVSEACGAAEDLVINGANGYRFNPGNVDELAATLLNFVERRADLGEMGQNSARIIDQFTPKAAARQMLKAIEFAVSSGEKP